MADAYIKRDVEKILKTAALQFPAVIVTGPRQSGKTRLLKHLFSKSHRYVSLDNPELRLMSNNEPNLFLENYPPPVIIDEVQYAPGIFSYLKMFIDKNRRKNGQFLLTGSQVFPLMAKAGESLAGRISILTLLSFSCREQFSKKNKFNTETIKKRILSGGFPEVITKKKLNLDLWFAGYLQTYLERDLRQLRNVGDLMEFQRFLQLLSALNGQTLNLSNLSKDLGIAVNTVKAWISILEVSGQIVTIRPFYLNKGKRLIKSPKVYFLDTGLLCYLSGITAVSQIFKGPLSGQFLETLVLNEIIRYFHNCGRVPRIFWWRTSYGEEVDFIIEDKGKLIPIEVKLTSSPNRKMAEGLISFSNLFSDRVDNALLVNLSAEKLIVDKKVISLPFGDFIQQFAYAS